MKTFKTVIIPHLRHTVHFMDLSKLQGTEIKGSGFTCISGDNEITIFLEDIENTVKNINLTPWIAHEIMHAIQIMCDNTGMQIQNEQEHTAYLMHYLMCEVMGIDWK